jgi:cell division protein FtsB
MKNTVTDELINKVYQLTKALTTAESIIKILEQENEGLKQTLSLLSNDYIEEKDRHTIGA